MPLTRFLSSEIQHRDTGPSALHANLRSLVYTNSVIPLPLPLICREWMCRRLINIQASPSLGCGRRSENPEEAHKESVQTSHRPAPKVRIKPGSLALWSSCGSTSYTTVLHFYCSYLWITVYDNADSKWLNCYGD